MIIKIVVTDCSPPFRTDQKFVLACGSTEPDFDHPVSRFTHAVFRRHRRLALAHPTLDDAIGRNAVGDEGVTHRVGAALREAHVVGIGAGKIGLADQYDLDGAVAADRAGRRIDELVSFRCEGRLVEVEENVIRARRRRAR
jgi:hypothetical protein